MNSFVDREQELEALRSAFRREGACLFVLYGRRRLGKTALLRKFAASLPGVYYAADRMAEPDALRFLSRTMAESFGEEVLSRTQFIDWHSLLAAFERFRPPGKSYLILDEYQYLVQTQPALSSILQKWWDETWSKGELMLVLCGSATSMMYRETLAASSPLYGRRTGQWLLEPLRFRELGLFFPGLDELEKVRMWALVGGVPHYARLASGRRGFERAFRELVLSRDGPLFPEARFLLQEEVSTPNVYRSLLHAMGNGVNRISELGARLSLPASQLTRYLSLLRDLRLVEREVPVTEANPARSKLGLHQIADPFLRLWYGAVAPYESLLEFGRVAEARRRMEPALSAHLAWSYERVCRQHVEDTAGTSGIVRVGRYWDRRHEIDIVGVDERGVPAFAAECKWSSRPAGPRLLDSLREKLGRLWPDRHGDIRLALFCSGGFTPELQARAKATGAVLVRCPPSGARA